MTFLYCPDLSGTPSFNYHDDADRRFSLSILVPLVSPGGVRTVHR
jgi:hypothetical protein